jgi:uncharacterized protein YjbI with pentapeptide repeats
VNTIVSNRATAKSQLEDVQTKWNAVLRDYVSWATDDKNEERQIAGALALGKSWGASRDTELIAGVRLESCNASADATLFGEARGAPGAAGREWEKIRHSTTLTAMPRRDSAGLDSATFSLAALQDCRSRLLRLSTALKTVPAHADEAELRAETFREVVHKSWSCLGRANLADFDLRHAALWEAHLSEANLEDADLCGADLRNARLTGLWSPHSSFALANLFRATIDEPLKSRALDCGAVEMDKDPYRLWSSAGYPLPKSWASWRTAGYPVGPTGQPLR